MLGAFGRCNGNKTNPSVAKEKAGSKKEAVIIYCDKDKKAKNTSSYNNSHEDVFDTLNYRYDERKEAYINFLNYKGGEFLKDEESFNRTNIIYPFKSLRQFSVSKQAFKIDEKPLFKVSCKE